jgi:hypothetical protein
MALPRSSCWATVPHHLAEVRFDLDHVGRSEAHHEESIVAPRSQRAGRARADTS